MRHTAKLCLQKLSHMIAGYTAFEKRCFAGMFVKCLSSSLLAVKDHEVWQLSRRFRENQANVYNRELMDSAIDTFEITVCIMLLGRLLLLGLALKEKKAFKAFHCYETVFLFVAQLVPTSLSQDSGTALQVWMSLTLLNHLFFSSNFWVSLALSATTLASLQISLTVVFDRAFETQDRLMSVLACIWLLSTLACLHLLFKSENSLPEANDASGSGEPNPPPK